MPEQKRKEMGREGIGDSSGQKPPPSAFSTWSARKSRDATAARIERLTTIVDERDDACTLRVGNAWSRLHYGGDFRLIVPKAGESAVSLVFVQTRNGNTAGADPGTFGGGATDRYLIYEGLSRVAADAVLSGAGSLHANAFFSVWHPELASLRLSLGLPRHPAQVIVSKRGRLDFDTLLFNVPDVPIFLVAGDECVARHAAVLRARPWVRVLRSNDGDLRAALGELRTGAGIRRISAIGGRFTATRLVDAGLVQDIYLTTTSQEGGDADTPWYTGTRPPRLRAMTEKEWYANGARVVFGHLLIA